MTKPALTLFQVNTSKETGKITLLIDSKYGLRPILEWPDLDDFKVFTETLANICSDIKSKMKNSEDTPERLLRQVSDDKYD